MSLDQPFGTDDFYEGDTGGDVKYKLRHFGKFKILVVVTVLVACLCIVFIALYALEKAKLESVPATQQPQPPSFCTGVHCIALAYDVIQQLNQSVDPCENFYEYACGGWVARNQLKPGETSKTGLSQISRKNDLILKAAIESAPQIYKSNEAVMKTYKFYNACVDADAVDARGDAPLKKFIRDFGGWHLTPNITGNVSSTPFLKRLANMLRQLTSTRGERPLLGVDVQTDPHNSNANIIVLGSGQTGMQKSYYYVNSTNALQVRQAYQQYMRDVAVLLGADPNDASTQMMEVYEFEAKIAMIEKKVYGGYTKEELLQQAVGPGELAYELRLSIEQFAIACNITTQTVLEFLQDVFMMQNLMLTKDDKILPYPLNLYQEIIRLYVNQTLTNPKVLDNYIMWSAISDVIHASSSKYNDAKRKYTSTLVGNSTVQRWETCLYYMQMSALRMSLGLLFIDKAFDKESKTIVKEMTRYIRDSFIDNLERFTWMDAKTKANAKEKALAIVEDIGYPDYITDPVKLAKQIENLTLGDQLFENTLALLKFTVQTGLARIKKPVDRDRWMLGPSETNGYYASRQNRIVFLAGILQPPFYNQSFPRYLNYGGMGMVVGHEITHGFDSQGRLFDKDGNLRSWWTRKSSMNFQTRASCLVNQYNQFTAYGEHLNGTLTLNENIADNGGIKIAYDGYKAWVKANQPEGALPGLGLTVDQLFFVGFAQPWCSIYTEKKALYQMKSDTHSYPMYRVLGTLQNDPTFARVFKCKKNAAMNPEKKCSVW